MKKLFIILVLIGLFVSLSKAQQWVGFASSTPGVPEVNILSSNAQGVSLELSISGIYTVDTIVNGTAFTRLVLPGGNVINPAGYPELPVLKYKIAIPACSGTEIVYNVVSRTAMNSCWVMPVPKIIPTIIQRVWSM